MHGLQKRTSSLGQKRSIVVKHLSEIRLCISKGLLENQPRFRRVQIIKLQKMTRIESLMDLHIGLLLEPSMPTPFAISPLQ